MKKDLTRLSKFLAVILRHSPEKFGIKLDEQGFTSLPGVWEIIENKFKDKYSLDDIKSIVIDGDKSGITIRAIRAYENGVIFYNPENEIYLSKAISLEYIAFPQ